MPGPSPRDAARSIKPVYELPKKQSRGGKPKQSIMWQYYKMCAKGKAVCQMCGKIISCGGGGTGNLCRHIRLRHPNLPVPNQPQVHSNVDLKKVTQIINVKFDPETLAATSHPDLRKPPSPEFICPSPPQSYEIIYEELPSDYCTSSKTTPQITVTELAQDSQSSQERTSHDKLVDDQVVQLLVKGFHSFKIVEEETFKKLLEIVAPNYSLPTKKFISSTLIPDLYKKTHKRIKNILLQSEAVCLTIEGWTSMTNEIYLAFTAHILQNAQLKSFTLGCVNCDKITKITDYKGLAHRFLDEVNNWGIENKISAVIYDSTAKTIMPVLKTKTSWRHFPCFAQTINNSILESMKNISEQIAKVRSVTEYFIRDVGAGNCLNMTQIELGYAVQKVKQDSPSRWNSTYEMLQKMLLVKEAIKHMVDVGDYYSETVLTTDDWTNIEKSMDILKIFYDLSVEMSSQKYVSISEVILLVKIIKEHVAEFLSHNLPKEFTLLVQNIERCLHEKFIDVESNQLTSQAMFLDPRFKNHGFSEEENYDSCLKLIKARVAMCTTQIQTAEKEVSISANRTSSLWSMFDKKVEESLTVQNPIASINIEVDNFLNEPLLHRCEDPFKWWSERQLVYPRLYKLAMESLCIVATAAPCQRIFTKLDDDVKLKRGLLSPKWASEILFLNHNLP